MIVLLAVVLFVAVYFYGTKNYNYWKQRGVEHDKPISWMGTHARSFFMQKNICQMTEEMYWKYPTEKIVGIYRGPYPELVVRDPAIAKQILISDFAYFYPRGLKTQHVEPMLRNLFFSDGDTWKLLRQRMTSAFTSGKLKAMFPLIVEHAERLQVSALHAAVAGHQIDARELMARYTTDFIGSCGFGLDADSLQDENSAFRQLGAKIFKTGGIRFVLTMLKSIFPWALRHYSCLAEVEKEVMQIVTGVQKERNYEASPRNDFIDILMEWKKKGKIIGDSIERLSADGKPETACLEMDDQLIAAQVFIFFAAGFETSSSATSTTLNELAHNPEVQEKVQKEIDRVLAKYGNKLSYDAIKEMTYLEWTFKEAMRIFPSLGFLVRESARKTTIAGVTIDKGVKVFIPLQAYHNDPQYFDNPSEFRPERFDPREFDVKNKYVYMPFGEGPRACIDTLIMLSERFRTCHEFISATEGVKYCKYELVHNREREAQYKGRAFVLEFNYYNRYKS